MTPAQGASNITNWVRRKMVAAVNKALRDIGKIAQQITENGIAEAERNIKAGRKAVSNVNKSIGDTAKKAKKVFGF